MSLEELSRWRSSAAGAGGKLTGFIPERLLCSLICQGPDYSFLLGDSRLGSIRASASLIPLGQILCEAAEHAEHWPCWCGAGAGLGERGLALPLLSCHQRGMCVLLWMQERGKLSPCASSEPGWSR